MKGIRSIRQIETRKLFTKYGDDVWQVQHYCDQPTVALKNLETGETILAAVGSRLLEDFIPLVPQEQP